MIHGVGVDILSMDRLEHTMCHPNDPFFKVYTPKEREEAALSPSPLRYYAQRFAAKEAVFKSLRMDGDHVRLSDIETLRGPYGEPVASLSGDLAQYAQTHGIRRIHLSLSNDDPWVIAYAVSEG